MAAQQRKGHQQKLQEIFHSVYPLSCQVTITSNYWTFILTLQYFRGMAQQSVLFILSLTGRRTVRSFSRRQHCVIGTLSTIFNSSSKTVTIAAAADIGRIPTATMKTFTECRKSATSAPHIWGLPRTCRSPFILLWSRAPPAGT